MKVRLRNMSTDLFTPGSKTLRTMSCRNPLSCGGGGMVASGDAGEMTVGEGTLITLL